MEIIRKTVYLRNFTRGQYKLVRQHIQSAIIGLIPAIGIRHNCCMLLTYWVDSHLYNSLTYAYQGKNLLP